MLKCSFKLVGIAPYSQGKVVQSPKNSGETGDAYEQRTWRERLHVDGDGFVFIPPQAIKSVLVDVAKFLGESVPGKGKSTYTKHFTAGVMVIDPLTLSVKAADVKAEKLFVPSDGKVGGGKRVWKLFPVIPEWSASGELFAIDPVLADKPEKIQEYLEQAGRFIGIGRFRPRNGGFNGRFNVESFKVHK